MMKSIICKDLVGVQSKGINFDEFTSGGLRGNHSAATWTFETVLGYGLRKRETSSMDRQVTTMEMNERESRTKVNKQRQRQTEYH
jgi:hypothetical protein